MRCQNDVGQTQELGGNIRLVPKNIQPRSKPTANQLTHEGILIDQFGSSCIHKNRAIAEQCKSAGVEHACPTEPSEFEGQARAVERPLEEHEARRINEAFFRREASSEDPVK